MTRPDRGPGILVWLLMLVSLVLPWIGVPLALGGLLIGLRGETMGWLLLASGIALVVLDVVIDVIWAHPSVSRSDEPDLNRRGAQLIGRTVTVVEPIEAGRGKVQIADTVWTAEGPESPLGAQARVVAVDGVVLRVEPQPPMP